jgi:hypothetical protein
MGHKSAHVRADPTRVNLDVVVRVQKQLGPSGTRAGVPCMVEPQLTLKDVPELVVRVLTDQPFDRFRRIVGAGVVNDDDLVRVLRSFAAKQTEDRPPK